MAIGLLLLSASQAILDALFGESPYLHDDRKPSSRTRSSGDARVHIKMHADESAREHERERAGAELCARVRLDSDVRRRRDTPHERLQLGQP